MSALKPIFTSKAADRIKIRLFRAAIESILCYGMESNPLTPTPSRSIDSRYRRMLRSALGSFYPDRISNDELREDAAPSVEHDSAKTAATPCRPHTARADQIEIPSRRAPAELRIWSSPPWARTDRDTAERYHDRPFIIVY
ncbi:hypothetical protein ACOMHN_042228 [Nucella lapillus]